MPNIRLVPQERWSLDGMPIIFRQELGDGLLLFEKERTLAPLQIEAADGSFKTPDFAWFAQAISDGRLKRLSERSRDRARRVADERDYGPEDLQSDPQARLRLFVLRGFDKQDFDQRGDTAIGKALARLWRDHPEQAAQFETPPSRTVRRWLTTRGTTGERRLRQMITLTGRVERRRRLPHDALRLMRAAVGFYWSDPGWSIDDAHARLVRAFVRVNARRLANGHDRRELIAPSLETLRQEIRRNETWDTYARKFGRRMANARFKGVGVGLTAQRFLRLGCIDHTVIDGIVVFDGDRMLPAGRPTLTALIDVRTRCIVGFVISFEPPSIYMAMECVKRASRWKPHLALSHPRYPVLANIFGRFDELVVDNGWEFAGLSFEDAMADIGTSVRWAPVKSPTYKAVVERFFGTLNHILNRKLRGATFDPKLLREMGYDPRKDAVLTISELEALIWKAISYYHVREHSTLKRPPAQAWEQDMQAFGIDVVGDIGQFDKMAGAVKDGVQLSTSGVRMFGLRYHNPAAISALLEDLLGTAPRRGARKGSATVRVKLKYNPANLGEVHVWNHKTKQYVTLPCWEAGYAEGLSQHQHEQVQRWAKLRSYDFNTEEERKLARADLIDAIRRGAPDLKLRERRAAARLLHPPSHQPSGDVILEHAPGRHDGLAPTIPHAMLAKERSDSGSLSSRPARKAKPKRASTLSQAPAKERRTPPKPLPPGQDPSAKWKGFE